MPVDRPDVVQAKSLKHRGGYKHALGLLLETPREFEHARRALQHLFEFFACAGDQATAHDFRQMAIERTDGR